MTAAGSRSELEAAAGRAEQYRLRRLQSYDWGTFADTIDIRISDVGYLFVGPSGSGKSTLLDAHAALLTPPKWLDFNVAARDAERAGRDRSAMSYVRGAWAEQSSEAGEAVVQHLRTGTTWSAIAETYENGNGKVVVLAQVLWVRGRATAPSEVKKLHLILQRPFDLRELEFFANADFNVRSFKQQLPDAFVRDEFSAYQEKFRGLLGIDSERALRLLHKTQSAKNLGDLNAFLRDFMLDAPDTFATANRLVDEFGELNAAHQAVVIARLQIETLLPAKKAHDELERLRSDRSILEELATGTEYYRDQKHAELLRQRTAELDVEIEGALQELERRRSLAEDLYQELSGLRTRREGLAGPVTLLKQQLEAAVAERTGREQKWERVTAACTMLGWALPNDATEFVRVVAEAKVRLEGAAGVSTAFDLSKDQLRQRIRSIEAEFANARAEIAAMEGRPSNIFAYMLQIRAQIVQDLGLGDSDLPFAGELIEVRTDALKWQGAIERVLHGFALSLLVDESLYTALSNHINDRHFGQRIVYYRMLAHDDRRRRPSTTSLVHKLNFARSPHAAWVQEELTQRYDYECAESMQAFRNASRALTVEGQIKHSHTRHEKDDRHSVSDRRRWVLGFDNQQKLKLYKDRAGELGGELAQCQLELSQVQADETRARQTLLTCQTLSNLSWSECDVNTLASKITSLQAQIDAETSARPELERLDAQIQERAGTHAAALEHQNDEEVRKRLLETERKKLTEKLGELSKQLITLTSIQREGLDQRFQGASKPVTLDTLAAVTLEVVRGIQTEIRQCEARMNELRTVIEAQFKEFNRNWAADSGGLDAVLASAEDYFTKLVRLQTDGLPRHEERFFRLLKEQSDQNLTLLSSKLDHERAAIRDRLELVNDSLRTAPFNEGTHLVIDTQERSLEEVRQFKQTLKEALTHLFSGDAAVAEKRFKALNELVKRLSSQDSGDKNWRNLVLDVRQHVEFVARELDEDEREVEIYRSGAGKSGGQRQKLAATCLAAALRYQLGGQDRALPSFATVVLDEAFDKADAEFTTMAMNIFKTFGFQMVVATPLKSVMTLEPFIGGACFVHITDRQHSKILTIEYDEDTKRLKLPQHVQDAQETSIS